MRAERERNIWKGVTAGLLAGLAGSWVMLRFIEGPGSKLQQPSELQQPRTLENADIGAGQSPDSVTMQAADAFVNAATGGRHLSHEGKAKGGTVVHYAFGTLMGGVYGGAAEYLEIVSSGAGAPFGTVLWSATDLVAVPAVGFAKWPSEEPKEAVLAHWMAHAVYGVSMELARRGLRRLL